MDEKKSAGTKIEEFFAGKGFYVVLFLCVAVIGVSAWSMLSAGTGLGADSDFSVSVAAVEDDAVSVAKTAPVTVTEAPILLEKRPAQPEPPAEETAEAEPSAPTVAVQEYYIWPVVGEIDRAYSTELPVWNPTMQDWRTHDGVDIACELGTQVKALANGKVTSITEDNLYGTTVVLSHANGLESIYANLAATPAVAVGAQLGVGQVLGAVGDTALGEAGQACHLHLAMRQDGVSIDPASYLP